ncbi:4Fe-4S binding protein [Candidatus Aminicenantes bacterium AC-335-B20]|jgi:Na+-translocating ferredoxin:NAD+ oxidoreductase RNF subunit RnfB|nr:4Fe-4S binding protein [SCandidatus Aminicenantes bacterium Aminicenantia_JdfR_composite]MCP2598073.1 4Fe-4S binding protein [Candidatus Aminicenantes bacterium AC-335-L06]MCP2598959.1 4Fe-4S binding protein [Candidatus Aminicenantes bacterium AC-335-B20]MCP2605789.1 4Fe-4S binding protein [Candidatus Aminicenantes bacterium AC-335-O07]MCP2606313.1 4Fe-4S binding protein [Candidatus Aminicenantes bacterium AC-708-I09]MCP2618343.1 4Fe-4S binding protein [Candidatus Aminicenantes bacterium AC
MNKYYHSIYINEKKCEGRMRCMRVCPTQAIRVRNGKAIILEERCIDCGECINACPNNAIMPLTDPFTTISKFKYTMAIPSPALYAQFGREILPDKVLEGLRRIGFNDAYDVAQSCGEVSFAIQEYLREYRGPKPLILSSCPPVVRLIQVKYPELIDLIMPIETPREVAGKEIKERKSKELGLKKEDIGAIYLTPCPAKMISIRQPAEGGKSHLDGAISIKDIYAPLLSAMESLSKSDYKSSLESLCILGIGWAIAGGISKTLRLRNSLAVSGLRNVVRVLDDIENGKLKNIDFLEAYSCLEGCVGGSLTVENVYISYNKIFQLIEDLELRKIKACPDIREVRRKFKQNYYFRKEKISPRPLKPLDTYISKAILKMKEKDEIYESLPKIDCGACGSPTCETFAEDVVKGEAKITDCIFKVPERFEEISKELIELLRKSPYQRLGIEKEEQ